MDIQDQVKSIIVRQGGIAKSADFVAAGISAVQVVSLCNDGFLERVRHGYYSLAEQDPASEEQMLAKLFPKGIVCVESALFHYGYSDFAPRKWSIAVPRSMSRTKLEDNIIPLQTYYVQQDIYELGKICDSFNGVMLPVYDRERTICDCFKYRTRLDTETFNKVLNAYANDTGKNLQKLSIYAKKLRVYKKVTELMEVLLNALTHESTSYIYSRGNNPTVNLCESKLAALEHAERAKLVSSGVAAISSAIMAFMSQGDHAVCVTSAYDWTRYIFNTYLKRFGCEVTFVDGSKIEDFENAIRPNTKVIYLESPATFTFTLQPLRLVAELAKAHGIKTVIDNTWSTPIYQNPIDFGIDLVVHSASKYFGGNSDLVAGVICGSDEDITKIFYSEFMPLGPAPDPFMAWLILRNLRTLHIRMPVHYRNALSLAEYLESRDDVESVNYPLLPSFPQYELAKEQLRGGSGLFSFRLKTRDRAKIKAITNSVKMYKLSVSWGGYESLLDPALVKYEDDEEVPDDRISLIRVHAGLEDFEMLKNDLAHALDSVK